MTPTGACKFLLALVLCRGPVANIDGQSGFTLA